VADRLEIPFYALDLSEEFDRIIDYFVDEYTHARTPNPCVMCNNWLKFGKLFEYADSVGAEFVATGHYARVSKDKVRSTKYEVRSAGAALYRGRDRSKDQSYVLFGVARHFLSRMLLPVGDFEKPQIRELAREIGLRVADKRDSQEICFVTSGDHADFVRRRRGECETAGEFVSPEGAVLGRHDGIEQFTIGQRRGVGLAFGEPRYVVQIEPETNRVVIGTRANLERDQLMANRVNWLVNPPGSAIRCEAQIRYNSAASPALAEPLDDGRLRVTFDAPRTGIAPGQAVVLYDDDQVLGGGWIE
jgi:tRNA-specific 2-thiouridylase